MNIIDIIKHSREKKDIENYYKKRIKNAIKHLKEGLGDDLILMNNDIIKLEKELGVNQK